MNDDDLKSRFGELRRRDIQNAPSFDSVVAKRPRRIPLFVAVVPFLAAAAVFVVWCGTAQRTASAPASAVAGNIEVGKPPPMRVQTAAALPLDFLLTDMPIKVRLDADPLAGLTP